MTKHISKTSHMAAAALFAAVTSLCAIITIPLGFTPVPINLGTLGMFLSGGILGRKYGTVSMCVYVFMGAAGIPVFAGFRAGPSVLAGPTGGYILGYILGAFIIGMLIDKLMSRNAMWTYCLCLAAGLITCYIVGTLWFALTTGTSCKAAIASCVLPFAVIDIFKIFIASLLIKQLRPFLYK